MAKLTRSIRKLRAAVRFDVTATHSYQRAELVALESPTDYRRGMLYAAELIRTAARSGDRPQGEAE